MDMTLTLVIL